MVVQIRNRIEELLDPRFFKALCDGKRLGILASLACCGQPRSVGQIASCCPIDLSVVSRHLGILRDAGILTASKRGKEVFYSVRVSAMVKLLRELADALESCSGPPASEERSER